MNNTEGILEDLRKITMLTGEISSIHEESLKKWPYIVFNDLTNVEIKYDLTKDYTKEAGEGYVEFRIESKSDQDPVNMRGDNLSSWVRDMFWKEIKIIVYRNDKEIYVNSSLEDTNGPK